MSARWEVTTVDLSDAGGFHLADVSVPAEAGLAGASRRSISAAQALLTAWFPTLPVATLAQTTDAATVRLGPTSRSLTDSPLTQAGFLEGLFADRGIGPAHLRLVRNRENRERGTALVTNGTLGRSFVHGGALATQLDAGFTAVVDGIDLRDESSMRLAEAAERVFGCTVNINAYLSLRPEMSFGAHWDDHEVIIVQLVGGKHWIVEQPVALSMAKESHPEATSGKVAWEGDLTVGQALYVPRGWGHRVRSNDALSLHYTITMPRLNGLEVLTRVLADPSGRGHPAERIDLSDPAAGTVAAARLAARAGEAEIRWAMARQRAEMTSRSTQRLSELRAFTAGTAEQSWVRSPVSAGWVVADATTDTVTVSVGGHHVRIGGAALELLALHGDGVVRGIEPSAEERSIVTALTRHGLLQVGSGDPGWGLAFSPG